MESSLEMGAGGMPSGRGRRAPPGGHCTAFIVVQSLSCAQLFITLWLQPGFLVLHYLLKFAQTHVHWVDDAIQPSHPLSLLSPFALSLSQCQGFSNESALCISWPKYWRFSISPSKEYSGLISFRIDWFDLLALAVWGFKHEDSWLQSPSLSYPVLELFGSRVELASLLVFLRVSRSWLSS